jgi:hypothetical protein
LHLHFLKRNGLNRLGCLRKRLLEHRFVNL